MSGGAPSVGGRIAMLGGTFDPPHVGHFIVAQDVLERLQLDRLLLIPASRPPHRDALLPAELRLDLVKNAVAGDERFEVSDLELRRDGPSYTVDTLEEIRSRRDPEVLFCVIGADQLDIIDSWHRVDRIQEIATLAVMPRGGRELPEPQEISVRFRPVEVTRIDVSGTEIRTRLREGRPVRYLVPERVRQRVEEAWARFGA